MFFNFVYQILPKYLFRLTMEKNRPTMINRALRHGSWITMILCLLTACSKGYDKPNQWGEEIAVNATLTDLAGLYRGTTIRIEKDWVVSGRVTSSDKAGNFYRSLMIEADGASLEIMAGIDHLHNDYPIGTKLYVRLRDLALGERLGVLQLGRMPDPSNDYPTDYIGSKAALDKHLVRSTEPLAELLPELVSMDELTPRLAGRLVRIDGLQWVVQRDEEGVIIDPYWKGYQLFSDERNNLIYTYVRQYADFSEEAIPIGPVSLIGILQYDDRGEGRYLIKLRNEGDCISD